ncbi:MAG: hypothetical protein WC117_01235 [Sphaerochaetaceae bacterium]
MVGGLYTIKNPIDKAMSGMQAAASTASSMDKEEPSVEEPKKTVGGTLQNSAGGALMGYTMSPMLEGLFEPEAIQLPDESAGLEIAEAGPLGGAPGFTETATPTMLNSEGAANAAMPSMESLGYGGGGALTEGTSLGGLSTAEAAGTSGVEAAAGATYSMAPGTLAGGLAVEGGAATAGLATEGMSATGGALVAGNTGAAVGTGMAAGSMGGAAAGSAAAGSAAAAGTATAATTTAASSSAAGGAATLGSSTAVGASTGSSAGWWGAAIGAVIGAATYLFS